MTMMATTDITVKDAVRSVDSQNSVSWKTLT